MNNFIEEYISKLRMLSDENDVKLLYRWFWDHQVEVARTARLINLELELTGEIELQPDLPCFVIGGMKGLLILSANPGWDQELNALEEAYCRRSPETYLDLMLNFFRTHPVVVGKRIRWWTSALSMVQLLCNWESRFGVHSGSAKWERAHSTELIGGWELFPFHSSKDGLSGRITEVDWLKACALESVRACIRLQPEILFVASRQGFELLRELLLPHEPWQDGYVGTGSLRTRVAYFKQSNGTEVIGISRQIFAAHRNFTNVELFAEIDRLRSA